MTILIRMTARLLRRGLAGLLSFLVGVWLFQLIQPLVADSMGGAEQLALLVERLPPVFQALIQTRPEFIAISGLAGYLSLGFTHPLYYVVTTTAVIGFGCRSLAGEIERGTIQLALARPISRTRVYAARVLGMVVIILALSTVGPLGIVTGIALSNPEGTLTYRHLLPTAVASFLLLWAIGGLTLLGAAAASTTGRAVSWATTWLIIFYFINYFAALWTVIEPLRPLSLFHYYDPAEALVNGALPVQHVTVLAMVGAAGAALGLVVFTRRDLPT